MGRIGVLFLGLIILMVLAAAPTAAKVVLPCPAVADNGWPFWKGAMTTGGLTCTYKQPIAPPMSKYKKDVGLPCPAFADNGWPFWKGAMTTGLTCTYKQS